MLRGTSLEFTFEDDFSFVSIRPRVLEAGTADPRESSQPTPGFGALEPNAMCRSSPRVSSAAKPSWSRS